MEKPATLVLWKTFTSEELQERGQELADRVAERGKVEREKKAIADGYKEKLDGIDGTIQELSGEIRAKGINVSTRCIVRFHTPRTAFKSTVRLDTGELVREEQMTPAECQENLFEAKEVEDLNRMMADQEKPKGEGEDATQ